MTGENAFLIENASKYAQTPEAGTLIGREKRYTLPIFYLGG